MRWQSTSCNMAKYWISNAQNSPKSRIKCVLFITQAIASMPEADKCLNLAKYWIWNGDKQSKKLKSKNFAALTPIDHYIEVRYQIWRCWENWMPKSWISNAQKLSKSQIQCVLFINHHIGHCCCPHTLETALRKNFAKFWISNVENRMWKNWKPEKFLPGPLWVIT